LFWLCYNGSDVGLFAISICLPLWYPLSTSAV
jgi:hypothetical protein